jgi:hypothetical protein
MQPAGLPCFNFGSREPHPILLTFTTHSDVKEIITENTQKTSNFLGEEKKTYGKASPVSFKYNTAYRLIHAARTAAGNQTELGRLSRGDAGTRSGLGGRPE